MSTAKEVVTAAQARDALMRLVREHFGTPGEHGRFSIPARPDHDDDLVLARFIDDAEAAEQRTREECAREVEALAQMFRDRGTDAFEVPVAHAYNEAESEMRALAERIRKGGG